MANKMELLKKMQHACEMDRYAAKIKNKDVQSDFRWYTENGTKFFDFFWGTVYINAKNALNNTSDILIYRKY